MSESFFNSPPENTDADTVYTMGGLDGASEDSTPSYLTQNGRPPFDFSSFIGSLAQIAQMFPGVQTRPQYTPGLTDLTFTRGFAGTGGDVNPSQYGSESPGTRFWSPGGGGPSTAAPSGYDFPLGNPNQEEPDSGLGPLLASLLGGMAIAAGSPEAEAQRIKRIESGRDITNFMPDFTYNPSFNPSYSPSNTFNPSYSPSTDITVSPNISPTNIVSPTISPTISPNISPSITQNPNIDVSPTITNTLEQSQQQTMGGGGGSGGGQFQLDDLTGGLTDDMVGGGLDSDFFTNVGAGSGARTTGQASINQSPSINVSPTITNTLRQQQAQWMGGGGSQQDDDDDDDDDDDQQDDTDTDTDTGNTNDTLVGGNDNDTIDGGNQNDTLDGGNRNDTLDGGNQNDIINIDDTLIGSDGNDTISSGNTTDTLIGGNGNDTIDGGLTDLDTIVGGNGNDTIIGGNQNDTIVDTSKAAREQTVRDAYQQVFGRTDVDQEGLDYWADQLAKGKTPTELLRDLVSGASEEDKARMTYRNLDAYKSTLSSKIQSDAGRLAALQQEYADLRAQAEREGAGPSYWTDGEGNQFNYTVPYENFEPGRQAAARMQEIQRLQTQMRDDAMKMSDAEKNFAAESYLRQNPDVARSGTDPLTDYLLNGRFENRPNNFVLDANKYYLEKNPDVAATGMDPYKHYLLNGFAEGRSDVFGTPEQEYLRAYPDAAQAIRNGEYASAADHYAKVGMAEGRTAGFAQVADALKEQAAKYRANFEEQMRQPGVAGPPPPEIMRSNFIEDLVKNSPGLVKAMAGEIKGMATDAALPMLKEGLAGAATGLGQLVGGDAAAQTFGDTISGISDELAPGVVNLLTAAFTSRDFGEFQNKLLTNAATVAATEAVSYALTAVGIPGAGPFLAAGMAIDAALSQAFNYNSPIQRFTSWVSNRLGSDPLGGAVNWVRKRLGLAEGGLVDLPDDSMYNDDDQTEAFAMGGLVPLTGGGKIVKGPGGGLDDLIPTTIDGKRAAALSDGEFVIPADVVSMMGDGSSTAGAKRLYDLVKGVRQHKTGTSRQAGPLPVGKILERTMR